MEDEPRKRSRFDQAEPVRKSRFDRRSRSPSREENSHHRSRSPLAADKNRGDGETEKSKIDAAAAAAAAAARINASLNAKKGVQHVHVPPIQKPQSPSAGAGAVKSPSQQGTINDEIYTQDGDFIKDIEINDLRNRYVLTKGSTQKMIKEKTGADVTTRGNYYPDKSMATATAPPLYLHVTSTTKEGLEKAVEEIEELMKQQLPNLVDERRFRRRDQEQRPEPFERDALGRRKWPEERIPIDLEPIPGFNLRAQVVGPGGSYVKHIQGETRCRVQIKGRGSGFIEQETGRESDEPMFLHVAGPDANEVERAKQQCIDLLEHVKNSYNEFKERGHQPRGGGPGERGGYGGHRDRNSGGGSQYGESMQYGGSNPYGGNGAYGGGSAYGQYGQGYNAAASTYGSAQSPVASADPNAAGGSGETPYTQEQIQQWAAYYAQNPASDPYAAYGGFGAVYAAWLQPTAQYGAGYSGSPQQSGPPPPPPDDNNAVPPPPPPPPGSTTNGYHSVPPPPGI